MERLIRQKTGSFGESVERIGVILICLSFLWFDCTKPAILRHDWFPVGVGGLGHALASIGGWDPRGIGSATAYPSSFVLVPLLAAVATIATPYGAQVFFFAIVTAVATWAAYRLGRAVRAGGREGNRIVVAILACALFNPWVYVQVVAGHTYMILAYAATLALCAELAMPAPSPWIAAACIVGIAPQIQFFVVAIVPVTVTWLRLRDVRPFAIWALLAMPVAIGLATSGSTVSATPLTVTWEDWQSLDLMRALVLRGYFARYDLAVGAWMQPALVAWALIAVAGIALAVARRAFVAWLAPAALILLLATTGTTGPVRGLMVPAFLHVPAVGLFRELYDLVGLVAVAYVVFAALAAARFGALAAIWTIAALALAVSWTAAPPLGTAVDWRTLPRVTLHCAHLERYAMLPAIQPMSFRSKGAGLDPDAYDRSGATPLDETFPTYPVDRAFGLLRRDGSTDALAQLGAGELVRRPYLQSTDTAPAAFGAFPGTTAAPRRNRQPADVCLSAAPLLARFAGAPRLTALPPQPGDDAVVFADATAARGDGIPATWGAAGRFVPIPAPRDESSAHDGWVDARLAFVERPDIAQPFGGALANGTRAVLPIAAGISVLASLHGRLLDRNGTEVARSGDMRYRWFAIPARVASLRCEGTCIVAAQGRPNVREAPARGRPREDALVPYFFFSWLARAPLPAGPSGTLRFNATYDRNWIAFEDGRLLPHVRIDGYANGWLVPHLTHPATLVMLDVAALAIATSEIAAVIAIALILMRPRRSSRSCRRTS